MEIIHAFFSISGPLVTLLGVVVSVIGTYLLTKWYHPYTEHGFVEHLKESPFLAMILLQKPSPSIPGEGPQPAESPATENARKRLERLERIVGLAEVNKERRSVSLVGIDLIFVGFVLQGIGAAATLVDVIWLHVKPCVS